uniref:Rho-related GTP-binding protein RhoU n=2 Tax=Ceratitis capitata TaxID=7213 RepID=W8BC92_CERCA
MTVKLANFFSNVASMPTTAAVSPPITSATSTTTSTTGYHQQQQHIPFMQQQTQQQSSLLYPYIAGDMDGDGLYDDDNMSLYSNVTTANDIMMQRSHSCNNSQRPLLGERKPPKMLSSETTKKNKKSTGINQPQRNLQQQQQQGKPQLLQQQKSYISPYVQQQKRDSAKGLHGFNDFDVLSQQYTEHLRSSPHIGYPYGSPPSPTAKSNDFVFDTLTMRQQLPLCGDPIYSNTGLMRKQQMNPQQQTGNDINETTDYHSFYGSNAGTVSGSGGDSNGLVTSTNNTPSSHYMGKSSRFEDDFCNRRNAKFAAPQPLSTIGKGRMPLLLDDAEDVGGPFIFGGVPHEQPRQQNQYYGDSSLSKEVQQEELNKIPRAAISSVDSVIDEAEKCSPFEGQVTVSSSDTSASSRDSGSNKGAKFLLRKGKSKRGAKVIEKKSGANAAMQRKTQQKDLKTPSIKCVLVGDGAVGKTNLILSYLKNRFNTEHVPTASDIYRADVMVNESLVHLTICDTAGQDTLDKLRQLCYPDSDVFVLCFSVVKPETFHSVKTKWAPKFAKTKAALILVGTQADLRNDTHVLNRLKLTGERPISYADAWDLAASVDAKYIETSSATQDKVKEVFDTAIWEALSPTTLPPTPKPPLWKKLLCLA